MTLNSFNIIRDRLVKACDIGNHDLPTIYYATKHREPIKAGTMEISEEFLQLKDEHEMKKVKYKCMITTETNNDTATKKEKIENLHCAEIKGSVKKCVDLILEKLDRVY